MRTAGQTFCALGLLLLAFVGYQLWGTSLFEHSAQSRLRSELTAQLHRRAPPSAPTTVPTEGDGPGGDTLGSAAVAPGGDGDNLAVGEPVGFLSIPRIGLTNDVIVEGDGTDQLRQGPGHYPGTPLPGQPGNAAIAGHRTTYAAPFYNLNELQAGDPITVQTVQGTFHYAVTQNTIVAPTDSAVLDSTATSELTLTTCNPRYSSAQRLVVVATLRSSHLTGPGHAGASTADGATSKSAKSTSSTSSVNATLADNGGGGDITGAVLWGLLAGGLALVVRLLWRRAPRPGRGRWGVLLVGTPVTLLVLFVFFGHVSAVLPASF